MGHAVRGGGPPASAHRWVGQYAAGGLGGISGAFACPSPDHLCVLVDGLAYLTDVGAPTSGSVVAHDQVGQVVPTTDLLLLVRFVDIVAIGRHGIAWRTERRAVDDLRVIRATSEVIECSLDNLGGSPTIAIDAATGEQIEGTPRLVLPARRVGVAEHPTSGARLGVHTAPLGGWRNVPGCLRFSADND